MALVGLVLVFAGCEKDEKYELRFSHYLHVTDNGMDCSDCHGEPGTPDFNKISHATCLDCHDEPEAEEISADTCGICHQEKQLGTFAAPAEGVEKAPEDYAAEAAPSRHIFVHTEALAGKCTDCHDYLLDENLQAVPRLKRSDVVAIRNKAHLSGQDCATCHTDMASDQKPASHDVAWMKRHGVFATQDDAVCSVCHTEDTCTDCHSVMQPASHNNMWRMHTHGTVASWNRESCQVCHVEDSCTSCHATTRPRSHNARWAAPGKKPTHCIACHTEASEGQGCIVCHEDGNDLLLHERYWPDNHNDLPVVEIGCYQCHWTVTP